MKLLLAIGVVCTLLTGAISAQAYEFELGKLSRDTLNATYSLSQTGEEWFTCSGVFNFSLSPDVHLWDFMYTGDKTNYNNKHLFQSSLNQFVIDIAFNVPPVQAWENTDDVITPVPGCAWAISSPNWNSPLRGYVVQDLVFNMSTTEFSGTLVSDGLIHWATSSGTLPLALADYQNNFRFAGNFTGDGVTVYANTVANPAVPEPASIILGLLGLSSIAGLKRAHRK